jgi:carbonic anhydrase/acetyltransferase-like protein (isoleucine patch superfamily)
MIRALGRFRPRIHPSAFVHDMTEVTGDVVLKARSSLWPGVVLRGDIERITVGEESNIQDGSIFHTSHGLPVILGRGVTVGHGAIVHGCRVGNWSLIGMGAILLDGCVIGSECLVGAGALVPEGFKAPRGRLILGLPARIIRPLTPREIRMLHQRAANYVRYARRYRTARPL